MIKVDNPNESYFRKLIKGQIGLAKTYWAWFILFTLILKMFLGFNLDLQDKMQSSINEFFSILIYLLTLLYTVFIFFAIFRSADNYKGKKIWPFLAKLSITIYLAFSLFNAIYTFRLYYSKDFAVSTQINSYKEELPIEVDSFTKLINIKKEKYDIYYTYELNISDKNSYEYNLKKFKTDIQNSLCEADSSLDLLKSDYTLNYKYIDINKNEILNIVTTKDKCGEGIYDLEIIKELLEKQNY